MLQTCDMILSYLKFTSLCTKVLKKKNSLHKQLKKNSLFLKKSKYESLKENKKIEIPDFCLTCSIKCEILLAERPECIGLPNKPQ